MNENPYRPETAGPIGGYQKRSPWRPYLILNAFLLVVFLLPLAGIWFWMSATPPFAESESDGLVTQQVATTIEIEPLAPILLFGIPNLVLWLAYRGGSKDQD